MTGVLNAAQRYRLNHLDLVLPDGQPVRWAIRWLYKIGLPDRVYGPTLMLKICERADQEKLPIYLYGSRSVVIEALAQNLAKYFPALTIAGYQPSRFRSVSESEKNDLVAEIHASGAALVFVGLGCPRQETWAYEYREALGMPVIAVGAAFDFHAGYLPQAPEIMQRWGLEWLFRLVQEPSRLWKRYLFLNPAYLVLLVLQWTGLVKFDPQSAARPSGEMRYG
jgi:exopolysaccharide biosynthesis WecB/TagA/CpsF family protein